VGKKAKNFTKKGVDENSQTKKNGIYPVKKGGRKVMVVT